MNKKRLEMLHILQKQYFKSIAVCDPIEYKIRQRDLLYALSDFILTELDDYIENEHKVDEEDEEDEHC